jgi:hypothetical protein
MFYYQIFARNLDPVYIPGYDEEDAINTFFELHPFCGVDDIQSIHKLGLLVFDNGSLSLIMDRQFFKYKNQQHEIKRNFKMQTTSHQARELNAPKAPSQKERIFLHLLSAGPLTAKELSGTTQLQVTTVYARLNDLKRGFYHKGASYEAYEQEIINGEIRWGIRFQVRQFSEIDRIEQKIKYLTEKLNDLKRGM